MLEVTREKFHEHINRWDSIVSIVGDHPSTAIWTIRFGGKVVGKQIPVKNSNGEYDCPPKEKCLISRDFK